MFGSLGVLDSGFGSFGFLDLGFGTLGVLGLGMERLGVLSFFCFGFEFGGFGVGGRGCRA